ncbi:MAG TPA: toxin-antitoxin system, antitoxin component, Xre family protein [Thermoanaerobaculia bacterium]|nr:toxin-antitoxin system, antitoxin component, Xre family protein [Thermoanaerobaculia bacterium]
MADPLREQTLMEKIRDLSADKVTEVEDFVDFLRQRNSDRRLVQAAARLSEDSLKKVWDNPDDSVYDRL